VGDSGPEPGGLSRRSLLGRGLGLSGGALVAGVSGVAACGDSGSTSSGAAVTTTPVTGPEEALKRLLAGNKRFVRGRLAHPGRDNARRAEQAEHQTPFAVVLGCSDSRVPPEIVFDEGIGDLFLVRVAGNTANDDIVLGSIEYAASVLKSVVVVVLGHEECGAVKATVDLVTKGKTAPGHIASFLQPIVPAVEAVRSEPAGEIVNAGIRENVRRQVRQLTSSQPVLAGLVGSGALKIVGAEYELKTGAVALLA
jgi:carbonic anhydrase